MKTIISIFSLLLFSAAFIHTATPAETGIQQQRQLVKDKKITAISCSPNLSELDFSDSLLAIPLLEGWGNYRMPVTAGDDSAALYFQQGINMYYGFHIIEALASFTKAVNFDSTFAMAYWGQALSYGPNINDFGYSTSPEALVAVQKAKEFVVNGTEIEKKLVDAIQIRYSADSSETRENLDQLYADKMKAVHEAFPKNADVATLYADALMQQHPWDLYDNQTYEPKPWTPKLVALLDHTLELAPQHPGAAHYYIHAIEASDHPEKGLAVARNLPRLMPGVPHVVHMPSHIFIRSGQYSEGENVNQLAVQDYYNYKTKFPAVEANAALYLIHNLHMQASCASMDGKYTKAIHSAVDCRNSIDTSWLALPDFIGVYVQYIYMTPLLSQVRFGKWEEILDEAAVSEKYVYASLLSHFAKGMAFVRKHDLAKAERELHVIEQQITNEQLVATAPAYANQAIAGARVAKALLEGIMANERGEKEKSLALLQQAVELEDAMIYNEPRDWQLPTRHYLGNAYLESGKWADAERVFKEDLKINPKNGWALTGLGAALKMGHKVKEAAEVKREAAKAFDHADSPIVSSVL